MTAEEKTITIACSYIGQQEEKGNSGFKDKLFYEKMKARGFTPLDPWCALYLELVLFETYQGTIYENYINELCSKSAVETWKNFKNNSPFVCDSEPAPGCGIIWQYWKSGRRTWQGHAGIVTSVSSGFFLAIEGNGNIAGSREGTEVVLKKRYFSTPDTGLHVLGFIHPLNIQL